MRRIENFLDVEHEVIIEQKTPYFMGQKIDVSIRVRNTGKSHPEEVLLYLETSNVGV